MNMPKTLPRKSFDRVSNKIRDAAKKLPNKLLTAASDLKTQSGRSTDIGESRWHLAKTWLLLS